MAVAIARKFASEQHGLQLAARNLEQLGVLRSDLAIRFNVPCTIHAFDALDFESHQAFFDQLDPKPDIAVCVFGYMGENETVRNSLPETLATINTNYTGAVSILNVIGNYFALNRKGVIAGISSVAGERGRQSNYIYGSAKAGFTAYLSGLRNRLVQDNVHVVTVKPGFVYTRMTEGLKLPKPLTAHPSEVGDAVYKAVQNKTNVVYVRWMWRWIMLIIKSVPELIFKKLKM